MFLAPFSELLIVLLIVLVESLFEQEIVVFELQLVRQLVVLEHLHLLELVCFVVEQVDLFETFSFF